MEKGLLEALGNFRSEKTAFERSMGWKTQLYAFLPLSRNEWLGLRNFGVFPDSKAHWHGIQLGPGNKLRHTEVYSCVCQSLHLCLFHARRALSNAKMSTFPQQLPNWLCSLAGHVPYSGMYSTHFPLTESMALWTHLFSWQHLQAGILCCLLYNQQSTCCRGLSIMDFFTALSLLIAFLGFAWYMVGEWLILITSLALLIIISQVRCPTNPNSWKAKNSLGGFSQLCSEDKSCISN